MGVISTRSGEIYLKPPILSHYFLDNPDYFDILFVLGKRDFLGGRENEEDYKNYRSLFNRTGIYYLKSNCRNIYIVRQCITVH